MPAEQSDPTIIPASRKPRTGLSLERTFTSTTRPTAASPLRNANRDISR
ncbi:MAG: hypothetical protein BWY99_02044 [Synergistetes bacterium ADurb.BinA166]|nr:MAG: hypothetical protein BWY99_02044 [Synergistetes bacterium ADurb.BinA166]